MDDSLGLGCPHCGNLIPLTELLFSDLDVSALYQCPECGAEGLIIGRPSRLAAMMGPHAHISRTEIGWIIHLREIEYQPHAAMSKAWGEGAWSL